jgi:hypothetical protein
VWWCWWCGNALCSTCGDRDGHCGHAGADQVNDESASAKRHEDRANILARLKSAGFTVGSAGEMRTVPLPRPKGRVN